MTIATRTDEHGVLTITLDDGDKNVLRPEAFDELIAVLDASGGHRAVVLTGREGVFTAGLDVKWMAANGRAGVRRLLVGVGRSLMELWTDPRPTVCAATGHSIAAGSMFAMACDHAVAAEGGYWGLTETRIDYEVPGFAIALARANLRADRLEDLILPGARIDAEAAVEAGFADELAPPAEVVARASAHARRLAELPPRAYAGTKRRFRQEVADRVLADLEHDIAALTAHLD